MTQYKSRITKYSKRFH